MVGIKSIFFFKKKKGNKRVPQEIFQSLPEKLW